MGQILLNDLLPNAKYSMQVRSIDNNGQAGPWSNNFTFTTTADTVGPGQVVGLAWGFANTGNGSTLVATWAPPTASADGSGMTDLRDYQIDLVANGLTRTYFTTATRFDFTFEQNKGAFGTPQPTVQITVRGRDLVGNLGTASTTSATNPAPATPTGVVAAPMSDAMQVTWNPNTDADLSYYEIHQSTTGATFTPTSGTRVWSGTATQAVIKETVYSTIYVKVVAYDVFLQGTASVTDANSTVVVIPSTHVDTTPPSAVDTFSVTDGGNDASDASGYKRSVNLSWTKTTVESDLAGFYIYYKFSTDTVYTTIDITDPTTRTFVLRGLQAGGTYNFRISAYDFSNNPSASTTASGSPITLPKDSVAPNTPAAPTAVGNVGYSKIQVTHNLKDNVGATLPDDLDHFEIYLDTSSTITPTKTGTGANYIGDLATVLPSLGVIPVETFPVPARRANDSTNATTVQYYVGAIAVDKTGNRSALSATTAVTVGLIDNLAVGYASITDANIQYLTVTKLTAGSGFVNDLTVYSKFTLGTTTGTGQIVSSDYLAGTTGFKLSTGGLEINQGTIAAKALQLQAGYNIAPAGMADFEFNNTFYNSNITPTSGWTLSAGPTGGPKYGYQCLFISSASSPIYFTAPATYTIAVEPNTTYILSAWIYNNHAVADAVGFGINNAAGTINTSNFNLSTSSGWQRYWGTVTTDSTGNNVCLLVNFPTGASFYIDGIQMEKQFTGATTPSPWRPPSITRIDGGSIVTGSIQSSSTTTFGGITQPNWSLNTAGNAQLNNAVIRGHLILGDGSGTASDQFIQSYNYVAGSAGWAIKADGSAELNSVTVRGAVYASSGTFAGSLSGATGTFTGTVTGGTFQTATSGERIVISGADYIINFYNSVNNIASQIYASTSSNYYGSSTNTLVLTSGTPVAGWPASLVLNSGVGSNSSNAFFDFGDSASGSVYITLAANGAGFPAIQGQGIDSFGNAAGALSLIFKSNQLTLQGSSGGGTYADLQAGQIMAAYLTNQSGSGGGGVVTRSGPVSGNIVSWHWEASATVSTGGTNYLSNYVDGALVNQISRGTKITGGATKSFVIDHPTYKSKYLVHAVIEGPENAVFYRGRSKLSRGIATVKLPKYFVDLVDESTATVQIQEVVDLVHDCENPNDPCFPEGDCSGHTMTVPSMVVTPVKDGKFMVGRGAGLSGDITLEAEFFWRVEATRKDAEILEVEPTKNDYVLHGDGPYTYLTRK